MSKPNLLGFASSAGIYRNKRVRDFHEFLCKEVPLKVDFAELAPMLFQVAMAYACENQIDGNFSGYGPNDWAGIFSTNHIQVTPKQAQLIVKGFEQVGLFDDGKIRSWMKFNRHLADYEGIVRAKRKAGKLSAQKRLQEAKESLRNSKIFPSEPAQNPSKTAPEKISPSRQLWLLEKALETAKGKARRELLEQKRRLLEGETGVDLSEPVPAPRPADKPGPKQTPADFQRALVNAGSQLLQDSPELLTEGMALALVKSGKRLPADVARRFPKAASLAEEKAGDNPVPG